MSVALPRSDVNAIFALLSAKTEDVRSSLGREVGILIVGDVGAETGVGVVVLVWIVAGGTHPVKNDKLMTSIDANIAPRSLAKG